MTVESDFLEARQVEIGTCISFATPFICNLGILTTADLSTEEAHHFFVVLIIQGAQAVFSYYIFFVSIFKAPECIGSCWLRIGPWISLFMVVFNFLLCPIGSILILAFDLKHKHIFFEPFMIFYTLVCVGNLIVFFVSFLGPFIGITNKVRNGSK